MDFFDNYEINVSKNGQHFFATDARSLTTRMKALDLMEDLAKRFPAEEGFDIELMGRQTIQKVIPIPVVFVGRKKVARKAA